MWFKIDDNEYKFPFAKVKRHLAAYGILLWLAGMAGCSFSAPAPTGTATVSALIAPTETTTATSSPHPTQTASPQKDKMKTILALGDSYTIGTSVSPDERWPVQLAAALQAQGIPAGEPLIIARNGWTTGDLETGIQAETLLGPFDCVTLLIGVNNQYRGYPLEEYRQDFALMLAQATAFAGGDPGRVLVLSIPDWGVTPFAEGRDRTQIAAEIDAFNAANREETGKAGAVYVDITPISRRAADDPNLLASDGLHPSGEMYALWVEQVLPVVLPLLQE